jgi:hypothetical protein
MRCERSLELRQDVVTIFFRVQVHVDVPKLLSESFSVAGNT